LIERWFAELTERWIRRGTNRSTLALESATKHWLATWNEAPRPGAGAATEDPEAVRTAIHDSVI
jgi:hypothetical protein